MRRGIFGSRSPAALSWIALAACGGGTTPATGVDGGGGIDGASTIDGSVGIDGGTVAGAPGGPWTAVALIDDPNVDRPVAHRGNDIVTGMSFETPDKGLIITRQDGLINTRGGAVFVANRSTVTSIAFSGDDTAVRPAARHTGSIAFVGLERTPTGYIAMAYTTETIASDDGGATFTVRPNAAVDRFGIEATLAYRVTATGTTIVRETGIVSTSDNPPGPDAVYQDIWAPFNDPGLPAAQCQGGPRGSNATTPRNSTYVSSDRRFVAYAANPALHPEICISTDGGDTFFPHPLDVPADASNAAPTGVTFTSATTGITWFASRTAGSYLRRTTDGGATWTGIPFPPELAGQQLELPAAFFAPDGQHGWLVGFNYTAGKALALRTSDGGASWGLVTDVADAVTAAGGDKLRSGFALDATHVWLGGDRGLVIRN